MVVPNDCTRVCVPDAAFLHAVPWPASTRHAIADRLSMRWLVYHSFAEAIPPLFKLGAILKW